MEVSTDTISGTISNTTMDKMEVDISNQADDINKEIIFLWKKYYGCKPRWLMPISYQKVVKDDKVKYDRNLLDCAMFIRMTALFIHREYGTLDWSTTASLPNDCGYLVIIIENAKDINFADMKNYQPENPTAHQRFINPTDSRFYDTRQFLLFYKNHFIGFGPSSTSLKVSNTNQRPCIENMFSMNGIHVTKDWKEFAYLLWIHTLETYPHSHIKHWFMENDNSFRYALCAINTFDKDEPWHFITNTVFNDEEEWKNVKATSKHLYNKLRPYHHRSCKPYPFQYMIRHYYIF